MTMLVLSSRKCSFNKRSMNVLAKKHLIPFYDKHVLCDAVCLEPRTSSSGRKLYVERALIIQQ